jgi:hypothetical protein
VIQICILNQKYSDRKDSSTSKAVLLATNSCPPLALVAGEKNFEELSNTLSCLSLFFTESVLDSILRKICFGL